MYVCDFLTLYCKKWSQQFAQVVIVSHFISMENTFGQHNKPFLVVALVLYPQLEHTYMYVLCMLFEVMSEIITFHHATQKNNIFASICVSKLKYN